jgi:vancomycin resistance protein YoaR
LWATAVLAVLVLTGVFVGIILAIVPRGCVVGHRLCEGLRVEGTTMPLGADLSTQLRQKARELAERTLEITVAGVPNARRTFHLGELGVELDTSRMTDLAYAVGRSGSLVDRILEARRSRRGEIDIAPILSVDTNVAQAALAGLKDEVDELPVSARVNLKGGGSIPEAPGHFLSLDQALERIRGAAWSGAGTVELERIELMPRLTSDFVERIATGEPLARFQTWFSRKGDQETRAHNIDTATARLDGVVLLPQEVFSFNGAVGPRTVDNGFSKGWEIFKGEMVEGIGGGTCQVASTLHAAAVLGGLDIIERLPHSRPSAYITMGLDATVVYPIVDLKLRNPFDFPVVVHGWVDGGTVIFELLGKDRPARVTFGREVVATRPFTRKVDEKPGIPADRAVRKQHGIRGYKVQRTRTIAYRDGTSRRESNIDFYPPTSELYLVAPGADPEALLPPFVEPPDPLAPPDPSDASAAPSAPTPTALLGTTPAGAMASNATALASAGGGPPGGAASPTLASPATPQADPHIVEAPGVHPPHAEQVNIPKKVVIHSPPLRKRPPE